MNNLGIKKLKDDVYELTSQCESLDRVLDRVDSNNDLTIMSDLKDYAFYDYKNGKLYEDIVNALQNVLTNKRRELDNLKDILEGLEDEEDENEMVMEH